MCGIVGFNCNGSDQDNNVIERMLAAINHRGPDHSGTYVNSEIALGSALLSIVDIGQGQQPVFRKWAGENYVGVFNGEIYNYREIRKTLEAEGVQFTTYCDTEVVLAAYALWGAQAIQRFEGQWALAIWETHAKTLFLCRDPFGIKPLFYHSKGHFFAFASEPKALLQHPSISAAPNVSAIQEYFLHGFAFAAGYCQNHRSFYEGIHSLEPGCWIRWTVKEVPEPHRYFHLASTARPGINSFDQAVDMLRESVSSSVSACLMGDAKIGVALSGGLDSSIITSVAAEEASRRNSGPLLASCITYEGQMVNEDEQHANLLAEWLENTSPINLQYTRIAPNSYLTSLDEMINHFDEPHWEIKQLAMFNNYRTLKDNGAKVVLTGEGADELFYGYYHRFPGFRNPVLESAESLATLWARRIPSVNQLFQADCKQDLHHLMHDAINHHYSPYAKNGIEPDRCMQFWYLATFLHWLLVDNDRCSMAFSIEGRFPFLNQRVFQAALAIPAAMQIGTNYGQEKLVLRKAFSDILPTPIWRDRGKSPLPSPLKLQFHQQISAALITTISEVPSTIWDVLSRTHIEQISREFETALLDLESNGHKEDGGERLTSYLTLSEEWSLRTTHVFGILTLLRWWKLNFS